MHLLVVIGSTFSFFLAQNRAFHNPWHLSQWRMMISSLSTVLISNSFQQLLFNFHFCSSLSPSVFSSLCPPPIFNYPPGRIHSLLQFSFCPEIIIKPTFFFRSTWPLTLQYFKSFHKSLKLFKVLSYIGQCHHLILCFSPSASFFLLDSLP